MIDDKIIKSSFVATPLKSTFTTKENIIINHNIGSAQFSQVVIYGLPEDNKDVISSDVTKFVFKPQKAGSYRCLIDALTTQWLRSNYFEFTVIEGVANTPPSINNIITNSNPNGSYTISYTVNDADNDSLNVELKIDNGNYKTIATNIHSGAKVYSGSGLSKGNHTCYLKVTDGKTTVTSNAFNINVVGAAGLDDYFNDYKSKIEALRISMQKASEKMAQVKSDKAKEEAKDYTDTESTKINEKISQIKVTTDSIISSVEKIESTTTTINKDLNTVKDTVNNTVKSVDVFYAMNDSPTIAPTSGWQTTSPTWVNGKYIWSRTTTVYVNKPTTTTTPVCITGAKGQTGITGSIGQGVDSITEEYYLSTSKTTQSEGSWVTTPPMWETGKYMWTRSKIVYKNPTEIAYTIPVCDSSWEVANNVDNKVIEVKKEISQIKVTQNSIAQKVDYTEKKVIEIDGEVTSLEERLHSAEQTITKDAIIGTVGSEFYTKGETESKLSEIKQENDKWVASFSGSGGANLLKNSGFKAKSYYGKYWLDKKTGTTEGIVDYLVGEIEDGWSYPSKDTNTVRIRLSNKSNVFIGTNQIFKCVIGKEYTASFYCAAHRANKAKAYITNSAGTSIITAIEFDPSIKSGGQDSKNWLYKSFTFKASEKEHRFYFGVVDAQADGYLWMARPMINEGDVALSYMGSSAEAYDGKTQIDADGLTIYNGGILIKNKDNENVIELDDENKYLIMNGNVACLDKGRNVGIDMDYGRMKFISRGSTNPYEEVANIEITSFPTDRNQNGISIATSKLGDYICIGARDDAGSTNGQMYFTNQDYPEGTSIPYSKKGIYTKDEFYFRPQGLEIQSDEMKFNHQIYGTSAYNLLLAGDNGINLAVRNGTSNNILFWVRERSDSQWGGEMELFADIKCNGRSIYGANQISSDERLKRDIKYLEPYTQDIDSIGILDMYDYIKNLKPAVYKMKAPKARPTYDREDKKSSVVYVESKESDREYIGFIAQDVKDTKVGKYLIGKDLDGMLCYDVNTRISITENALKIVIEKTEKLELQNEQIIKENKELKDRLKIIEGKLGL